MLPKPHAIIFDWDGTIVDSLPLINEAMNAARAQYGMAPQSLAFTKADSVNSGEAIFRRDWGEAHWQEARTLFLDHFLARHLERFGDPVNGNHSFMPGAYALLGWLKEQDNITCGVLTNRTRTSAGLEIEHLGYSNFFKAVVCHGESPKGKPSAEAAYHILDMMHLAAGPDVWLVGDTHGDVACGINAGLTAILVHDGNYQDSPQPILQIRDCHALLKLLKQY